MNDGLFVRWGAMSQPLGLRRAETRGLHYEPPGEHRSQIGYGRDHPMDRDRLLPADLERAGLAEAGLAFFVAGAAVTKEK
jgi:hypothetical protein